MYKKFRTSAMTIGSSILLVVSCMDSVKSVKVDNEYSENTQLGISVVFVMDKNTREELGWTSPYTIGPGKEENKCISDIQYCFYGKNNRYKLGIKLQQYELVC